MYMSYIKYIKTQNVNIAIFLPVIMNNDGVKGMHVIRSRGSTRSKIHTYKEQSDIQSYWT